MKKVSAIGKFIICTLHKEEQKKGALLLPDDKKTKSYIVYDHGESKKVHDGDRVYLTGFAQPLELDSETFYIVQEEHVGAIIKL